MTQDPGGQQDGRRPRAALPARSPAEANLYLDLHPCECGTPRTRERQELREGEGGGVTSVYAGTCPGCGQEWSIAFSLPDAPPPAGHIGGPAPSRIIDPGEWLLLSDQDAGIPAGEELLSPADRARLGRAADEADEAAKFIPAGHDRVPDDAFTTTLGQSMRDAFPGRFTVTDLRGRAQLYRAGAQQDPGRRPRRKAS
jgi:hypothetical protein